MPDKASCFVATHAVVNMFFTDGLYELSGPLWFMISMYFPKISKYSSVLLCMIPDSGVVFDFALGGGHCFPYVLFKPGMLSAKDYVGIKRMMF